MKFDKNVEQGFVLALVEHNLRSDTELLDKTSTYYRSLPRENWVKAIKYHIDRKYKIVKDICE